MADEKKLDPQALKERIGRHMRTADEFTRFQRFEEALKEIEAALELDPKNNYARQFLERVKLMHKRVQLKTEQETVPEVTLEERMEQISKILATADDFIQRRDYKHALEEVAKVYKIDPKNYYAQAYSERIDVLMEEESSQGAKVLQSVVTQPSSAPLPGQVATPTTGERGSLLMYRELLKDVWLDGKVNETEAQELTAMQELFGITPSEHQQLEREVKIEAYAEALRIAWKDNNISEVEQKTLLMMREKYGITSEEQKAAEAKLNELKRSTSPRGVILVVEPEREILVTLTKLLKPRGYAILMAAKPEDAVQLLMKQVPTIILSEILFPGSSMDGVSFFKKLREHPSLRTTPFIFISSITEKKVLHAAYRLGASHVLPKPIDAELLLAIFDGLT